MLLDGVISENFGSVLSIIRECGVAVGRDTALQAGRSRVRFPMSHLRFFSPTPSGRTVALVSNQPQTEMGTRNIFWFGENGRCLGLKTLPLPWADCLEILGASTSWNRTFEGLYRDRFIFIFNYELSYIYMHLSLMFIH